MQIVRIQNCIHVAQAVAGQARDLWRGASGCCKPCDGRAAQIVKCQPDNAPFVAAMRHDA